MQSSGHDRDRSGVVGRPGRCRRDGLVAAGSPETWALTAAQFATLRDDPELLAVAARIAPDRLPPLLFSRPPRRISCAHRPRAAARLVPATRRAPASAGPPFGTEYRSFCLEHRERLLELCGRHRYQMNEVGRCAHLLPALAPAIASGRELAVIDIGTGAGLALYLDRYRTRSASRTARRRCSAIRRPGSSSSPRFAAPAPAPTIATASGSPRRSPDRRPGRDRHRAAGSRRPRGADVADRLPAAGDRRDHALSPCGRIAVAGRSGWSRRRGDALAAAVPRSPRPTGVIVDSYVHVFFGEEATRGASRSRSMGSAPSATWIGSRWTR